MKTFAHMRPVRNEAGEIISQKPAPVSRVTFDALGGNFGRDKSRRLVVTLKAGDVIEFRPERTRQAVTVLAVDMYRFALRCQAGRAQLEKARATKERKKEQRARRRQALPNTRKYFPIPLAQSACVCETLGMTTTDQRRAKAGGEYGANGEWYEGGKFIATQEDTIKTAPMRHEITPEELARRESAQAEHDVTVTRLNAWLAARAEQFAPVLVVLEARLNDQWGNPVAMPETFHQSLGRQLRASGSVSPKQAQFVAEAVYGRQNKRNAEQYDALLTALVEEFA